MQVLKPIAYQESQLISTTATNADANYSSGTTYALAAKVTYNNKRWESLQASNLNHQPDTSPTWWLDLGADNKHAMFDSVVSTSTTATTTLTVVTAPGVGFDSLALINVDAGTISVTVRNGLAGAIVYENTAGLSGGSVTNWYDYFFSDPLVKRTQIVFTGIPKYSNAHITLTLTAASGTPVSISQFLYGDITDLGTTQYGASAGMIDYSIKQTDEFGTISFVERAYSKRLNSEFYIQNSQLNKVQNMLYSVRAKPSVWIASDDPTYDETLVVYGFIRDFNTTISYPTHSLCSIEIEGLS